MLNTSKEAAALDEHAPAMSQESRATFSIIFGEFIGVTEDHLAWFCISKLMGSSPLRIFD